MTAASAEAVLDGTAASRRGCPGAALAWIARRMAVVEVLGRGACWTAGARGREIARARRGGQVDAPSARDSR